MLTLLNRISSARHPDTGASRRYVPNAADFRSIQDRSTIGSHHFPDPLFGPTMNSANAMPSEYDGEKLSRPHEGYRDRALSVASSAPDFTREPIPAASAEMRAFHQSLPEINFSLHGRDPFDEDYSMHQSLPELAFSKQIVDDSDMKKAARDIDPIPLQHIRIPGRGSLKTGGEDTPLKKPPRDSASDDLQASSSSSSRSNPVQISKDLMECLDKMTYHSIADDNPFEPIPLAPQQEKAHASKNLSDADKAAADRFRNSMLDDSERDEFAEG